MHRQHTQDLTAPQTPGDKLLGLALAIFMGVGFATALFFGLST